MPDKVYDLAIVGTGPAGMAAAIEFADVNRGSGVIMFEKGPLRLRDDKANRTSGFGGCGAFCDGKITFSPEVGGYLAQFLPLAEFERLSKHMDNACLRFGAPKDRVFKGSPRKIAKIKKQVKSVEGLRLIESWVRHLGTEMAFDMVENIRNYLLEKGVDISLETEVLDIRNIGEIFEVEARKDGRLQIFSAQKVIVAPGRSGQHWVQELAQQLGLGLENTDLVDIGVRVEVSADIMQDLTDILYDAKFVWMSKVSDNKVRTFCVCPKGAVTIEENNPKPGFHTVNGHSYAEQPTENTNFAILVTIRFTEPFKDPISYAEYIVGLANKLGNKVIVHRLKDLRNGRRSKQSKISEWLVQPTLKEATPGNLGYVLPYDIMREILGMLEVLDRIVPGINNDDTLLYGVEVKPYTIRVKAKADDGFETDIPGLYVAGDGVGYTRGLVQALMMGSYVAKKILEKNTAAVPS